MFGNIPKIQIQTLDNKLLERRSKEMDWQSKMFDEVDFRCELNKAKFKDLKQIKLISERKFNKIMKKNNLQAAELKAYIYFFFDKFGNKLKDVQLRKTDLKKMYKVLDIKY